MFAWFERLLARKPDTAASELAGEETLTVLPDGSWRSDETDSCGEPLHTYPANEAQYITEQLVQWVRTTRPDWQLGYTEVAWVRSHQDRAAWHANPYADRLVAAVARWDRSGTRAGRLSVGYTWRELDAIDGLPSGRRFSTDHLRSSSSRLVGTQGGSYGIWWTYHIDPRHLLGLGIK